MGYLYLAVALAAGLGKGFCGKKISGGVNCLRDCISVNLMRMFFCALVGFFMVFVQNDASLLLVQRQAFPVFVLSSVSMSAFCVCWMYAYKNEAYMFLSIFTMLGTVITCICSRIFYSEPISALQWVGMAVLMAAVYIMAKYNKGIKGALTPGGLFILITGCFGCAIADFSQKIYMHEIGTGASVFNFYTYMLSFFLLAVILPFTKKRDTASGIPLKSKSTLICFIMSFCLYLNTASKTLAAGFLSSAEIYPVLQGANLIFSAVMAHILFKEKINTWGIMGIICAFSGLILL